MTATFHPDCFIFRAKNLLQLFKRLRIINFNTTIFSSFVVEDREREQKKGEKLKQKRKMSDTKIYVYIHFFH